MDQVFFDSWQSLLRTLIIAVLSYVSLIFLLRIFGKRTLSKMNAFDFVVTIALGSSLASVILSKNVALADGVLGFVVLMGLQFIISSLSTRYKWVNQLIKSTPTLIVYKGEIIQKAMREERINEDDIYAVLRQHGCSALSDADVIVLETDGSLSLIKDISEPKSEPLMNITLIVPEIRAFQKQAAWLASNDGAGQALF